MSKTDPKNLSEKINQLDSEVAWFYGDEFSLDAAIPKYEAAIKLAQNIEKDLTELKNKVEVLADFTKS